MPGHFAKRLTATSVEGGLSARLETPHPMMLIVRETVAPSHASLFAASGASMGIRRQPPAAGEGRLSSKIDARPSL